MTVTAVALSGGADSAFAAYLLKKEGPVLGLFALLSQANPEKEIDRVRSICVKLHIPLHIVDLREAFQEKIIGYFKEAYRRGLTPNPCVLCNREIKFGLLLQKALELGAERLATGHYARLVYDEKLGQNLLYKARDQGKDQSYFLAYLTQEQLNRAVFPLGEWSKEEVLRRSLRLGLFTLTAPESQEVCFIKGDYRQLFASEEFPPGEIVTVFGRVVGRHHGLYAYTIGQRRGLRIRLGRPYYVVSLDTEKNRVIIGPKKYLYAREFLVHRLNWLYPLDFTKPFQAEVRIRYRHKEAPATVYALSQDTVKVVFERPQPAITPGQFAVFYQRDLVLGAGEIGEVSQNF